MLLQLAHLVALVLATWRLTDAVLFDRVFAWLRPAPRAAGARVVNGVPEHDHPGQDVWAYLVQCPRCMSFWIPLVVTVPVYLVVPWLNWPLALSWTYLDDASPWGRPRVVSAIRRLRRTLRRRYMAAVSVTVCLVQPYKIRPEEERAIKAGLEGLLPMTVDEFRRRMSEQFILGAARQRYGDQMARPDARVFRGIKDALDDLTPDIVIDGTQAEFLFDLFLSDASQDKVLPRPEQVNYFYLWLDYLEELRARVRATPAVQASAHG